jgi:hypothetical protein
VRQEVEFRFIRRNSYLIMEERKHGARHHYRPNNWRMTLEATCSGENVREKIKD